MQTIHSDYVRSQGSVKEDIWYYKTATGRVNYKNTNFKSKTAKLDYDGSDDKITLWRLFRNTLL